MNTKIKRIGRLMLGAALFTIHCSLFTSCSPETFDGPNQNGIPSISNVDISMNVDQTVNQATFSVANMPAQTYAVWKVNGNVYSTLNPMNWANNKAGTYDVELRLGNRNGFSQGSITKQFTFENSQVDLTPYINRVSRTWRINYAEQGHMGCGEPGTDGSNWWSAAPGDKADWGVYDDRITFTADGGYTYDPGEGGTVYVNNGTSLFPEYNTLVQADGSKIDFMAPVETQNTSYHFDVDGDKIVLKMPAQTLFPYLSSDAQFANPVFTVTKLTNSEMILLYEGEGITWRFMFTSKEDDAPKAFKGYKFDSDGNMLKDATWEISRYYAHGDGWEGYNAEDITYTNEGNKKFVVTLPYESNQRWQAQFQLQNLGGVSTQAGKNYDFSIKLKANQDLNNVRCYCDPKEDGRWKWILFDLDLSFRVDRNMARDWLIPGGVGTITQQDNTLFVKLMENAEMRDAFLSRMGQLLRTTFSAENVVSRIEARYNLIAPEMEANCARWGWSISSWQKAGSKFVSFARSRPKKMVEYLAESFGLSDSQAQEYFYGVE